jgi:hypothetical protein
MGPAFVEAFSTACFTVATSTKTLRLSLAIVFRHGIDHMPAVHAAPARHPKMAGFLQIDKTIRDHESLHRPQFIGPSAVVSKLTTKRSRCDQKRQMGRQ